jgi:hypothetical protein
MTSFSKIKMIQFVAMMAVAVAAVGCSSPEEAVAQIKEQTEAKVKAEHKKTHPEVTVVGTFDGCEVKYYDRGNYTENFFISKCVGEVSSDTTTQTSLQRVGGGKFAHYESKMDITQEQKLAAIDAKKAALMAEQERIIKEEVEKKNNLIKKAKEKLSSEELEALGLK